MSFYLGYRDRDADTPFGSFYRPQMAPLPGHVVEALEQGPQAEEILLGFDDAAAILEDGYLPTETGYGTLRDGGIEVSVRTDMPGVTPAMWSWWFGWHGCDSRRYKLWHPRAHVSARWSDGDEEGGYVGRTSLIREYIGSGYSKVAIQFIEPSRLNLDVRGEGVAICARLGSSEAAVDVGWFIHYVRPAIDGSEMRSRFWLGGRHIRTRSGNRLADKVIRPIAARQVPNPRDLMVHCAQEMNHLAGFLPDLYKQFADGKS